MASLPPQKQVIVVGGGWAGLSCAHALSKTGHRVTLLEAAPQCGGRARSIQWKSLQLDIDNGQHILLGAYDAFLTMLQAIGLDTHAIFNRIPFQFSVSSAQKTASLNCKPRPYLPKKLSLIIDLCRAHGWTWGEKYQIAQFMARYVLGKTSIPEHMSVLDLLKWGGQSDTIIQYFWEPILLAALTTPLNKAAAQYAIDVLKDSFSGKTGSTDILIPKVPLSNVFAIPMVAWLMNNGHAILCHQRAISLMLNDSGDQCIGVQTKDQAYYGKVVLALPFRNTQTLIQPIPVLQHLHQQLGQLTHESIVTLYYAFPKVDPCFILPPMQAIVQDNTHYWLFCQHLKEHTLLSAVFSGLGPHLDQDKIQLLDAVQADIQTQYPILNKPLGRKYIQEKFAAFCANTLSQTLKPGHQTALPGLWLCGDYTHHAYPSTLEGAIQSGTRCAASIK